MPLLTEVRASLRMLDEWRQKYWAWLTCSALPLWARQGADSAQGGFHELLGLDGAPVSALRRARVQVRQSFVFAHAGALGWDGPWRAVEPLGFAYLEDRYRRSDGLYATLAGHDGVVTDQTAMTYDQAFALLAAAALLRQDMGPCEGYALGLLDAIESARTHSRGGRRGGRPPACAADRTAEGRTVAAAGK